VSVVGATLLAALGFMVLIVLHELGHFAAAKAVGMQVDQFSLFFGPKIFRKRIGSTEYAIGTIPAGGYVSIAGMNPNQELSDEARTRAYYAQPVWKRIVVISAGPAMNFLLGFVLFVVFFWLIGAVTEKPVVDSVQSGFPAHGVLQRGDRIVSVNGVHGSVDKLAPIVQGDKCAQSRQTDHCQAARPVTVVVERHGQTLELHMTPVYDAQNKISRLGFTWATAHQREAFGAAVSTAGDRFSAVTRVTAALPARIFNTHQRKQIHGIVGSYETTRQTILHDPGDTVGLLAVISLALAVVNLFPFLPLDGGHIFWGLVELVRRRPVPFSTMERASFVGFALVAMLFVIGFTNDISTLSNGGFQPAR
jgi:regulator of sigma E protease